MERVAQRIDSGGPRTTGRRRRGGAAPLSPTRADTAGALDVMAAARASPSHGMASSPGTGRAIAGNAGDIPGLHAARQSLADRARPRRLSRTNGSPRALRLARRDDALSDPHVVAAVVDRARAPVERHAQGPTTCGSEPFVTCTLPSFVPFQRNSALRRPCEPTPGSKSHAARSRSSCTCSREPEKQPRGKARQTPPRAELRSSPLVLSHRGPGSLPAVRRCS
jgi:hypothetical protein